VEEDPMSLDLERGCGATITRELPQLTAEEIADLARVVVRLAEAFQPIAIYLYGSQARGTASWESDIDLLVVVPESREPGYRRDQVAYAAIGDHLLPLDIMVLTRNEFEQRITSPASLPATVQREGRMLYAA